MASISLNYHPEYFSDPNHAFRFINNLIKTNLLHIYPQYANSFDAFSDLKNNILTPSDVDDLNKTFSSCKNNRDRNYSVAQFVFEIMNKVKSKKADGGSVTISGGNVANPSISDNIRNNRKFIVGEGVMTNTELLKSWADNAKKDPFKGRQAPVIKSSQDETTIFDKEMLDAMMVEREAAVLAEKAAKTTKEILDSKKFEHKKPKFEGTFRRTNPTSSDIKEFEDAKKKRTDAIQEFILKANETSLDELINLSEESKKEAFTDDIMYGSHTQKAHDMVSGKGQKSGGWITTSDNGLGFNSIKKIMKRKKNEEVDEIEDDLFQELEELKTDFAEKSSVIFDQRVLCDYSDSIFGNKGKLSKLAQDIDLLPVIAQPPAKAKLKEVERALENIFNTRLKSLEPKKAETRTEVKVTTKTSDESWFNNWKPSSPTPVAVDTTNKVKLTSEELLTEAELTLSRSYTAFLSARRSYLEAKSNLNRLYRQNNLVEDDVEKA